MKFFVPDAAGAADAERFWAAMRARMKDEYGLATTPRRIQALENDSGAIEIGAGTPSGNYEDVVMAIIECEALADMYFIFTRRHGELQGPPYPFSLDGRWRVVDFE